MDRSFVLWIVESVKVRKRITNPSPQKRRQTFRRGEHDRKRWIPLTIPLLGRLLRFEKKARRNSGLFSFYRKRPS